MQVSEETSRGRPQGSEVGPTQSLSCRGWGRVPGLELWGTCSLSREDFRRAKESEVRLSGDAVLLLPRQ